MTRARPPARPPLDPAAVEHVWTYERWRRYEKVDALTWATVERTRGTCSCGHRTDWHRHADDLAAAVGRHAIPGQLSFRLGG